MSTSSSITFSEHVRLEKRTVDTVEVQIFVHEIFREITPPAGLLCTKFRFWSRSVTPNDQKKTFSLVETLVISCLLTNNYAKDNSKRKFVLIQYQGVLKYRYFATPRWMC